MSSPEIVGILLAGGAGTRFRAHGGTEKLLHPFPDGTPVAVASLRHLLAATPRVVAVVRPGSEVLAAKLAGEGAEVTVCADAAAGMGHTLAHAVKHAGEVSGYVVALADMPFIRPATIAAVADRVRAGALISAPARAGERGHPVAFSARLREELLALRGDAGARDVLKRHAAEIDLVPTDDPGVVHDIDTPSDLHAAK